MRGSMEHPDNNTPDIHSPANPEQELSSQAPTPPPDQPLDFALPHLLPQPPPAFGLGGTIAIHIAIGALLLFIDNLPAPEPKPTDLSIGAHSVTQLVAPPAHPLTLPELMARNQPSTPPAPAAPSPTPKPPVPQITAPARRPGAPAQELIAEPPPLPSSNQPLPQENMFTRSNQPTAAPPVIQQTEQPARAPSQEQPKLSFETPSGQVAAGRSPGGRIPLPQRTGVDELGRAMARSSSSGGITVGDTIDAGASAGGAPSPNAPTRNQSAVQLLTTDTMGVDFRPYLVTVLASVRRNWLAILPESARMGRRGRVQVQFAISRDGSVPKLVISSGSGAEALDRAAVAGISASNPFPPLPSEFQGPQIRLQLTFAYNLQ